MPATVDIGARVGALAHIGQEGDRLGQGILLTGHAGHEAAPDTWPRASSRRRARHASRATGSRNDSRDHSSQATTPQRTSICHATARLAPRPGVWRREAADSAADGAIGPRPMPIRPGRPRARGERRADTAEPDGRRPRDDNSDRTAEKASAVTMPRATRSQSPSSTSDGNRPDGAASSDRKHAPSDRSTPRMSADAAGRRLTDGSFGPPVASPGPVRTAASSHGRSWRVVMANGVAGDGSRTPSGRRPPVRTRAGAARHLGFGAGRQPGPGHLTARHSSSSQRGSYPATRAGST